MGKQGRNIAIGAALAAGAGYVAGILTAPKSGKETRKDIQRTALKKKAEAEKTLKNLHSELTELIKNGKSTAKDVKETAKSELVEALGKAQVAKEKAREILSAVHEGDADDEDLQKAVAEAKSATEHLKKYVKKTNAKAV